VELARADAAGEGPLARSADGIRAGEVSIELWAAKDPTPARELLAQWMTTTAALLQRKPPTNLGEFERFAAMQYAIARWAPALGMGREAGQSFSKARASLGTWARSLADGQTELDGIFAVGERMVASPATAQR
jgi:hypothetical protein